MLKMQPLTQHVQEGSRSTALAETSQSQWFQKPLGVLLHCLNTTVISASRRSKQQPRPQPTAMSDLLAGRFLPDISQHSSPRGAPETKPPPDGHIVSPPGVVASRSDLRTHLFARLGIRSEETEVSVEECEMLIASLSHIEEKKRRDAAHALADLYEKLPPEKQMHARINLILMTWRDANAYARIAAIKALAKTKMPDTSEALQVALRDEDQDVRAAAAMALGEIPGKTPVVALISTILRDKEHWSVRAAAIRAMGESGERAFLNIIHRSLDDEDDSIRIAAIHALAQVEGIQAAPRLALIAQRERQPHLKHAAILELENLGTDVDERH